MKRRTRKTGTPLHLLRLAKRRRRAARLFNENIRQAEVARQLHVSRQSVSRWYKNWKHGGVEALRGAERAGRRPKLQSNQIEALDIELRKGARAHGFSTDLWTLQRVVNVIEKLTGVRYHRGHVWKILRRMEWSLQRPTKRAKERNERAVRDWITRKWPEIKKKRPGRKDGSYSKTRAGSPRDHHSDGHGHRRERHQ